MKALTVDAETPEGFCPFCEVETAGEAHSLVMCIDWLREKRFAAEYDKHVAESELAMAMESRRRMLRWMRESPAYDEWTLQGVAEQVEREFPLFPEEGSR